MQRSVEVLLVTAFALAVLTGTVQSATHHIPPLFRDSHVIENPNARMNERADDLNYRLPNTTRPERYDIVLTTQVDQGIREFSGIVKIDLVIIEDTIAIVLHARQLNFTSATIQSGSGASEELSIAYEEEREFLTLTRKGTTQFAKDTKWTLTVVYSGRLRTDNGGFYLSSYTDVNGIRRFLATTQFESTDARHAFPCYDEPAIRANFTITINHSPTYSAISNMPVNEAASSEGKTVFHESVKMSTYIVAFIVSDFKYSEGVLNGLPQRIYSRPGSEHEQEFALVSGMLIQERLAEYYGINFTLPKLDQAAIPDFSAGAMENWGLATYREEYMLYNKDTSTANTQTNIATIIAHEYSHQWFGNYVAINWWSFLWLKEGFATLFYYKATDEAYPEWDIWQQYLTSDFQSALVNDAGNSPRPMTYYVQKPSEISRVYDTVSYAKAGSVLNMWNHALTDKVFQRGVHNYLNINQYSSAVESQLFEAFAIAAKEENYAIPATMADMMGSWSRQGGYPLLTVTRNYVTGTFTVTQQPFFNNENTKADKSWYIPFNYAVQSKPDFRDTEASHYLANVSEVKVNDKLSINEWLILNKQSTGYYRINYDERNWKLIIDGLINSPYRIHTLNRAQLLHDAYRFSATKRLSHSILMDMLTYLVKEDQYAPWSTTNSIINTYNRYLSGDSEYKHFQDFVAEIVNPIFEKLGVDDVPGEHHLQKSTRNIAINLACLAGIDNCLKETNNKLKALFEEGTPIEPNVQSQIYCNGLKQTSNEVYDFVYDKLMASTDQALRRTLISSLGCSQTESQLEKFVSSSIDKDNKLRNQERTTLLSAAYSRGQVGLLVSIDFLDKNWDSYGNLNSDFGGSNPLDDAIRGMSLYVVNKEQENKLLALVAKVKDSPHISAGLEASVNSNIEANYNWLQNNRGPLMSWLVNYHSSGATTMTVSLVSMVTVLLMAVSRLF